MLESYTGTVPFNPPRFSSWLHRRRMKIYRPTSVSFKVGRATLHTSLFLRFFASSLARKVDLFALRYTYTRPLAETRLAKKNKKTARQISPWTPNEYFISFWWTFAINRVRDYGTFYCLLLQNLSLQSFHIYSLSLSCSLSLTVYIFNKLILGLCKFRFWVKINFRLLTNIACPMKIS